MKLNWLDWIALVLVVVGAVNWGLVSVFEYNLVEAVFTAGSMATKIVYDVVAVAGVYLLISALVKSMRD